MEFHVSYKKKSYGICANFTWFPAAYFQIPENCVFFIAEMTFGYDLVQKRIDYQLKVEQEGA